MKKGLSFHDVFKFNSVTRAFQISRVWVVCRSQEWKGGRRLSLRLRWLRHQPKDFFRHSIVAKRIGEVTACKGNTWKKKFKKKSTLGLTYLQFRYYYWNFRTEVKLLIYINYYTKRTVFFTKNLSKNLANYKFENNFVVWTIQNNYIEHLSIANNTLEYYETF